MWGKLKDRICTQIQILRSNPVKVQIFVNFFPRIFKVTLKKASSNIFKIYLKILLGMPLLGHPPLRLLQFRILVFG